MTLKAICINKGFFHVLTLFSGGKWPNIKVDINDDSSTDECLRYTGPIDLSPGRQFYCNQPLQGTQVRLSAIARQDLPYIQLKLCSMQLS